MRGQLRGVVKDFWARIRSNGERLCVRLTGHRLNYNAWELNPTTMQVVGPARDDHFLVESVEVLDCKELIARIS